MEQGNDKVLLENQSIQKSIFFLGAMAEEDIQWILYAGQWFQLPKGAVLVEKGVHATALYILLTGVLSVWLDQMGGRREVTRMTSGEIIGEISFIDRRAPSATVTAAMDCLLLKIPKDVLAHKIETDFGFGMRFYRALAYFLSDRLRSTMSRIDTLSMNMSEEDAPNPEIVSYLPIAQARLAKMIQQVKAIRS